MNLIETQQAWRLAPMAPAAPPITLWTGLADMPAGARHLRESLKLGLRALASPGATRRWLDLLNSQPALRHFVGQQPRMVLKIYRPYLSMALTCRERVQALASHYEFLLARGLGPMVSAAAAQGVVAARVEGKSGRPYTLELRRLGSMEREGELVLQLMEGGRAVYSVAFTFARLGAELSVRIGCVQGPRGEDKVERVREATRDLHGVRPKNLLVNLVRQLGYELGCREVRLVGNANRVVRRQLRRARVHSDLNQLWHEMGARLLPCGDYVLPCARLPVPDLDAVPSKRRAEVRRRHALHHTLAADLLRTFT